MFTHFPSSLQLISNSVCLSVKHSPDNSFGWSVTSVTSLPRTSQRKHRNASLDSGESVVNKILKIGSAKGFNKAVG